VLVSTVGSTITPVVADHVRDGVARAARTARAARVGHRMAGGVALNCSANGVIKRSRLFQEKVPALAEAMQEYYQGLEAYKDILLGGWDVPEDCRRLLGAAIYHALWFETWRSLVRGQQLSREDAVELMVRMVNCAGAGGHHA
jgi:hypothetical protein